MYGIIWANCDSSENHRFPNDLKFNAFFLLAGITFMNVEAQTYGYSKQLMQHLKYSILITGTCLDSDVVPPVRY